MVTMRFITKIISLVAILLITSSCVSTCKSYQGCWSESVSPTIAKMVDDLSSKSISTPPVSKTKSNKNLSLAELMGKQDKSSSKKVSPPVIATKSSSPRLTNIQLQLVKSNIKQLLSTNTQCV